MRYISFKASGKGPRLLLEFLANNLNPHVQIFTKVYDQYEIDNNIFIVKFSDSNFTKSFKQYLKDNL